MKHNGSTSSGKAVVTFQKPTMRWLWGGFGFHDSEATMTPLMTDEFRDQRVLKSFREISPTYSRLFAGYANWTKEAMDRFADYYDATFRLAGTTLYVVPARSMTFLTTDYRDRTPSAVADIRVEDGVLRWTASAEPEHCYYRVFEDGKQISSTVATELPVSAAADAPSGFRVVSVDKWGNEGNRSCT